MPAYGLRLDPSFGFARVHGVEADGYEIAGGAYVFRAGDRIVYQIPERYVLSLEVFATRLEAVEWMRETARGSSLKGVLGAEGTARRGPARNPVIEKVSVVIEERNGKR